VTQELVKPGFELDETLPESHGPEVQESPGAPAKACMSLEVPQRGTFTDSNVPCLDHISLETEDLEFCPDCHVLLREADGDKFCPICGVVWGPQLAEETIPFDPENVHAGHSEGSYSPSVLLAFGAGLGTEIGPRELYRILPKSPLGRKDLPLRVCQLRALASTLQFESSPTRNLLSYGSSLSRAYGFGGRDDLSIKFADELGRVLRRVGRYLTIRGKNPSLRWVATAIFCVLVERIFRERSARIAMELKINKATVEYFDWLLTLLHAHGQKRSQD
jgi:hypothetical protein